MSRTMTLLPHTAPPPSDADLIALVRAGDVTAFGDLHDRHRAAAVSVARHLARDGHDADDLVSEGFARVLAALRRGAGPSEAFRPYLLTTVRRLAYDRTAHRRRERPDEALLADQAAPDGVDEAVTRGVDSDLVVTAYMSLPERWQAVLWHTEVEGQRPAEVAPLLGIAPNAVAALAYRAREGLRQAYLSAHVRSAPDRTCREVTGQLGGLVRGGLSRRASARVREHVDDCDHCAAALGELTALDSTIRTALATVVVGGAAATTWVVTLPAPVAVGAGAGATVGVSVGAAARRVARQARRPQVAAGAGVAAVALVVAGIVVVAPLASNRPEQAAVATPEPSSTVPPATDAEAPVAPAPAAQAPAAEAPVATSPQAPAPGPTAPPADVPPVLPPPFDPPTSDPPPVPTSTLPQPPTTVPPRPSEPIPSTTRPADLPTTTTTTTVPVAPPTTEPLPPVPVALTTDVFAVGALVAARHGMVGVNVVNVGEGTVAAVEVAVELDEGAGPDTGLVAPAGCLADTSRRVTCRVTGLAPGASAAWFLRVDPAPPAGSLPLAVTTSAPLAPDHQPERHQPTLAVEPAGPGVTGRFATVMAGDTTSTGGSVLTCPPSAAGCAEAALGQGSRLDDNDWPMVPVDVDDDPSTPTSSRATVDLPAGAEVVFAGLYWGGSLTAGSGGGPPPASTEPGSVLVTAGGGPSTRVVAAPDDLAADGSSYQAFADVTDLVRRAGEVTVADVHASTGYGAFGGWGLVVVHTDPAAPRRTILVFDGQVSARPGVAPEMTVGGYVAPADASARVGLVAFDGDTGLVGDRLLVEGVPLTDGLNPADNVGNGTISRSGLHVGGRTPSAPNTFGIDVDDIDARGVLVPGTTRATVRLETDGDVVHLSALTVVVDLE